MVSGKCSFRYPNLQLSFSMFDMALFTFFRSTENKMISSNLAVIFAPNLFQSSEPDKISAQTDKKLRLQAAVVQTLIDHAEDIGKNMTRSYEL